MQIRSATPIALGLMLAIHASPPAMAQNPVPAPVCERLVEFRDGSILRLQLPADYEFEFREASHNTGAARPPVKLRLDHPQGIRFSKLPALNQLRTIQQAVAQLNSDDFKLREQALRTLVTGSKGFRPLLEDLFEGITVPESRWRLATALKVLPPQDDIYEHAYDEIATPEGTTKGDIKNWRLKSNYRGAEITLDRKSVRAIRIAPRPRQRGNSPIIATTEAIRSDLDTFFPSDCARIDFEHDSNGDPLRPGQNISRRFIPDGMLIRTSIADSFFSVNDYPVKSRSGGQSGANHDPLYHGVITLEFCVPGNEHEPAGVTHVGLYAAIVEKGGTTLAAFDASGHRIANVTTGAGPHEFIGLRSNVPIHTVKIIPDEDIDPDITIDDIVFSVPESLDAGGAPQEFRLDFAGGERLFCDEFQIGEDVVTARPSGGFAGEISFPARSLLQLHTPTGEQAILVPGGKGTRFWILLDDGSTLLARENKPDGKPRTVLEDRPLDSFEIAAIWSENGKLAPLPTDTQLDAHQVAIIATTVPTILENPSLTPDKLTAIDGDSTVEYLYNRLPTVWLKKPTLEAGERASGFIRLTSGERLVLGTGSAFRLDSFDSKSVTLTLRDHPIKIPLESVTTLRLPIPH